MVVDGSAFNVGVNIFRKKTTCEQTTYQKERICLNIPMKYLLEDFSEYMTQITQELSMCNKIIEKRKVCNLFT